MPYSNNHKCYFFHIPRTAGTSIEYSIKGLRKNHHHVQKQHMTHDDMMYRASVNGTFPEGHVLNDRKMNIPHHYDELYKFTIVRNPFARLFSIWRMCPKWKQELQGGNFTDWVVHWCDYVSRNYNDNISPEDQAAHWCHNLSNTHIAPMFRYLNNVPDLYVGRFEDLQKSWLHITKNVHNLSGAELMFSKKNTGRGRKISGHYTEYYTPKAIEAVKNGYSKDLDIFQYEFGC